jgi:hypothetical protein
MMNQTNQGASPPPPRPTYRGDAVKVGPYQVYAGGIVYLRSEDLTQMDVLVPLFGADEFPFGETYAVTSEQQPTRIPRLPRGRHFTMLVGRLPELGGVPDDWEWFLKQKVIPMLQDEKKLLAFCMFGQGRTDTWLASLVAILEPQTADPIAAIRERYRHSAVETLAQAKAIFALRGEPVPLKYDQEFAYWDC